MSYKAKARNKSVAVAQKNSLFSPLFASSHHIKQMGKRMKSVAQGTGSRIARPPTHFCQDQSNWSDLQGYVKTERRQSIQSCFSRFMSTLSNFIAYGSDEEKQAAQALKETVTVSFSSFKGRLEETEETSESLSPIELFQTNVLILRVCYVFFSHLNRSRI